jgi:hypothetical protein
MWDTALYIGIPILAYWSPLAHNVTLTLMTLTQGLVYAIYPALSGAVLTWT